MKWNGMEYKVQEARWFMGLKVHQGSVKKANYLEWLSVVSMWDRGLHQLDGLIKP